MAEGKSGAIIEYFRTMDGTDCTQSITKLQRCGLVDPYSLRREYTDDVRKVINTQILNKLTQIATKGRKK